MAELSHKRFCGILIQRSLYFTLKARQLRRSAPLVPVLYIPEGSKVQFSEWHRVTGWKASSDRMEIVPLSRVAERQRECTNCLERRDEQRRGAETARRRPGPGLYPCAGHRQRLDPCLRALHAFGLQVEHQMQVTGMQCHIVMCDVLHWSLRSQLTF